MLEILKHLIAVTQTATGRETEVVHKGQEDEVKTGIMTPPLTATDGGMVIMIRIVRKGLEMVLEQESKVNMNGEMLAMPVTNMVVMPPPPPGGEKVTIEICGIPQIITDVGIVIKSDGREMMVKMTGEETKSIGEAVGGVGEATVVTASGEGVPEVPEGEGRIKAGGEEVMAEEEDMMRIVVDTAEGRMEISEEGAGVEDLIEDVEEEEEAEAGEEGT